MTIAQDLSFIYNSTLTIAGNILPTYNAAYNLGTSTSVYNNIYVNSIQAQTTLVTTSISSGSTSTAGTITGQWTLVPGSKLQATYSDLAEFYQADQHYEPGTVLVFGGADEVTQSTGYMDRKVAGVVTTNPAYVMNVDCKGIGACIALQGRIPVKVVGQARKGDIMVTAAIPGHATATELPLPGTIIGKSLVDKLTEEPEVIEVAVGRF